MKFRRFELALLLFAAAAVLFTAGFLIGRHTGRVRIYVTGSSAAPAEQSPAPEEPGASCPFGFSGNGEAVRTALSCVWDPSPAIPSAARPGRTGTASIFRLGGRFP
ncbi:MAG: hypothetical protein IK082_02095 [Oscillospiraceae bacterium]|nr:hypothetical protein [Oscillospiraceae bacterium]